MATRIATPLRRVTPILSSPSMKSQSTQASRTVRVPFLVVAGVEAESVAHTLPDDPNVVGGPVRGFELWSLDDSLE